MPRKQASTNDDAAAAVKASARRLAEAVKRRRFELGIAQDDLADRGGPSVVTVRQVEQAKLRRPQGLTMAALDRALGWASGSAARVWLDGDEPTVVVVEILNEGGVGARSNPALGELARSVGAVGKDLEDEEVLFRLPPGLSPRQRETARRLAQQSVQTYLDSLEE
jgi:transcriptional regulator with XRE-family HTH domain